jgi:DNA polymerase IIIc chi subunit
MTNRVFFIKVDTNGDKLKKILHICQIYFENRQKLLIKTDSLEAASFIDDFLWKSPADGFLPHGIDSKDSFLSITHGEENPNQATSCFNLTKGALISSNFGKIYEFDDKTSIEKERSTEFRFQSYKKCGIPIASY